MAESLHILLGTSACLQWLCHSGERTVACGPLVYLFFSLILFIFFFTSLSLPLILFISFSLCSLYLFFPLILFISFSPHPLYLLQSLFILFLSLFILVLFISFSSHLLAFLSHFFLFCEMLHCTNPFIIILSIISIWLNPWYAEQIKMPSPLLIFIQSHKLIQVVYTNSHM